MTVSEADRRKMASIARDLAVAETNEEPSGERRREIIAWANAGRARRSICPLADDDQVEPPEEEFLSTSPYFGVIDARRQSP